jgi:hypothetical protein
MSRHQPRQSEVRAAAQSEVRAKARAEAASTTTTARIMHPVGMLVAAAIMLTGCAGVSTAPAAGVLSETAGFPANAPFDEQSLAALNYGGPGSGQPGSADPLGWLAEDRATATIVSYWSSTCPLTVTAIEIIDDTRLSIVLQPAPAPAPEPPQGCTEDLAPRTHVLAVPEGWGQGGDGPYSAQIARSSDGTNPIISSQSIITLWPLPTPGAPVNESIAIDTFRGVPSDITLPDNALDEGAPLAFWGEDRATLRVITWGSSSCPPPALSLDTTSASASASTPTPTPTPTPTLPPTPTPTLELSVVFGVVPPVVCTADFAPTTHVFRSPPGIESSDGTGSSAVMLTITIEQRDATHLEYRIAITDGPATS